jgi:hypothetical protein
MREKDIEEGWRIGDAHGDRDEALYIWLPLMMLA